METTKEFTHLDPTSFAGVFENTLQHRVTQRVLQMIKEDPSLEPIWDLDSDGSFKTNQPVVEGPEDFSFFIEYDAKNNGVTVWADTLDSQDEFRYPNEITQEQFVNAIANDLFGIIA